MVVSHQVPPSLWAQLPVSTSSSSRLSPSSLASLYPLSSEPPVTMVRVPQDMGVTEMGIASFECELSRPSVEVKWFKVRVCLDPSQQHPAVPSSLPGLQAGEGGCEAAGCCLAPLSTHSLGRMGRNCGQGPAAASTQWVGAASCS